MLNLKLINYRSIRIAAVATIIASLLEVMMSYSLALLVVDRSSLLIRNLLIVLGVYSLNAIFLYINMKMQALAQYFVSQDLKQRTDKWVSGLTHDVYHEKDHGERLSLYINDISKVLELTLAKFLSMVSKAATTVFILVALWSIHYSMVAVALLSLGVMVLVPGLFQKGLSQHILRAQEEKEVYLSKMRELLQGFDTFLENTSFSVFLEKSRRASQAYADVVLGAESYSAVMSAALTFINSVVSILALGILSYFVMAGRVEAGAFLSVTALLPSFGASVMSFLAEKEFYKSGQQLYQTKFTMIATEDYREVIYEHSVLPFKADLPVISHSPSHPVGIHSIELDQVRAQYGQQEIVFPEQLRFEKGKKYALIGESGSGKSSLLRILAGQTTSYTGQVRLNAQATTGAQFDKLSYVNQTTFLFNDTVRNNIDPLGQHDDDQLTEMLQLLNLGELDLGLFIEDNGSNLSGGQRQRLSIARALLRSKDFLLLDEATANLDKETAQKIENHILETVPTVIMISHHLTDTVRQKLDQVIEIGAA